MLNRSNVIYAVRRGTSGQSLIQRIEKGDTMQFRFATRETVDQPIVFSSSSDCPDPANGKMGNGDIVCCDMEKQYHKDLYRKSNLTRNHIYGYSLTIHVKERSSGFSYWRSVTNCSAVALEVPANESLAWKGTHFMEIIRIVTSHGRRGAYLGAPAVALAFAAFAVVSLF